MKRSLILLGCALGELVGCATTSQPMGFSGGYSDLQLSGDTFQVTFQGNGYTSRERVTDLLLLRAAELTVEQGYAYFIVVGRERDSQMGLTTFDRKTPVLITKHSGELTIELLHENRAGAYDARLIGGQLRRKYGLKE